MRKKFLIPLLLLLTACTEDIDLRSRSDYHDYLTVEATLNDRPEDVQQVILSRSISYFNDEPQPMVSGASVQVNDVVFNEISDGVYQAPDGYACESGVEYRLVSGEREQLEAQKSYLIGYKAHAFGFTGLIRTEDADKFAGCKTAPADLESIMIYTEQEDGHEESAL